MGWPKGKKRAGHINQDGTPHAKKGTRIQVVRKDPKPYTQTEKPKDEGLIVIKGATGQPVIEPCPKCGYAYADGGYCPDCGKYSKFDPNCPHCTKGAK